MNGAPTELQLKLQFAAMLMKNEGFSSESMTADELLRAHYPDVQFEWVNYVAKNWPYDEIVIAEIKRLKEYVPSQTEYLNSLWRKMQHPRITPEEYAKLAKVYADATGMGKDKKDDKDKARGKDKLAELAAMILDDDEVTTEETPADTLEESESDNGVVQS